MILLKGALKELGGWKLFLGLAAWQCFAIQFSSFSGDFLAWLALGPLFLLFRIAGLAQKRVREGWQLEEQLRNPSGLRLPIAEWAAGSLFLASTLVLGAGILRVGLTDELTGSMRPHPLYISSSGDPWVLKARQAKLPDGTELRVLIQWEAWPEDPGPYTPGEEFSRPLTETERQSGIVSLDLPSGAHPVPRFSHVWVPLPSLTEQANLALWQWFFWAPLLAWALALVRHGVRPALAACGPLSIAGIGLWRPPLFEITREASENFLVQLMFALHRLVPDLRGLLAIGPGFELRVGLTTPLGWTLWTAGAGVALWICSKRRTPQ